MAGAQPYVLQVRVYARTGVLVRTVAEPNSQTLSHRADG